MRASISLGMGLVLVSMYFTSEAGPVVYEETAKFTSPDPAFDLLSHVAVDGNHLLAMGRAKQLADTDNYYALFHFERQPDGSWLSRGKIDALPHQGVGEGYSDIELRGGIAVFTAEHRNAHVLERTATGWTISDLAPGDWSIPGDMTSEVRIVGSTIALAARYQAQCRINLVRKNAQGVWTLADQIVSDDESCYEGDFDVLGPRLMEYTGTQALISNGLSYLYDQINGAWVPTPIAFTQRPVVVGSEIALRSGSARDKGDILYLDRRDATGHWLVRDTLRSEDWYANVAPAGVVIRGNRAVAGAPNNDIRGEDSGSISILDRDSSGRYTHVATLLASDAKALGSSYDVALDGRTIAANAVDASGQRALYLYELPATLPQATRVQDNFEDVNAAGWTPFGATNWSVVQSNGSYVYRQANAQGDARAILDSPQTQNQAIEADLKLNTFGSTSWAGLVTRYTDPQNFYYVMIWNNQTIQIRNMKNGAFSSIASAPFSPLAGRTYRLRLEAIGTVLRAYVDGRLLLQARSSAHTSGRAGLTMWKTSADYDNVIVSTTPATELLADTFTQNEEEVLTPWARSPQNAWEYATVGPGNSVLQQTQLDVTARAINGAPARDQIVSADIRPLSFHASGTPFTALIARYVDASNYYYVLLNKSNTVSLRKLANGAITVLDEAPMTVQPNTTYRVRFEAIGTSLRVYVNGTLMAEAEDSTYPSGRYGLATYRATAQYDNFSAVRP
jgi:hypothetical protein